MNDSPIGTDRSVTFEPTDRAFVYAVVRRLVHGEADAEDVTQETLLRAFRFRASFRDGARYHTWLYQIAMRSALSYLRQRRRSRIDVLDDTFLEAVADPAKTPADVVVDADALAHMRRGLLRLPADYREVLLARTEGTETEVAARLGISVANVKIRAHRARKQLAGLVSASAGAPRSQPRAPARARASRRGAGSQPPRLASDRSPACTP